MNTSPIFTFLNGSKFSNMIRQIFSVPTDVKNGITAVNSIIDFRAVHFEAKQANAAASRKIGIRTLENP